MKQFVILGVVASALFAISASLSLWLQSNNNKADSGAEKPAKKKEAPREAEEPSVARNLPSSGSDDLAKTAASLKLQLDQIKERENKLDRRQAENEIVLQDIRAERESIEKLRGQVATELKKVLQAMSDLDVKAAAFEQQKDVTNKKIEEIKKEADSVKKEAEDIKKRTIELTQAEEKNLSKIAATFDSMEPASAAKILQNLSDSGKLDNAAKILGGMKETKAAKVLAELQTLDAGLASQMLERMRSLKKANPMNPMGPNS